VERSFESSSTVTGGVHGSRRVGKWIHEFIRSSPSVHVQKISAQSTRPIYITMYEGSAWWNQEMVLLIESKLVYGTKDSPGIVVIERCQTPKGAIKY
jgi:hypothetical protein